MDIIGELKNDNDEVIFSLYKSTAASRRNDFRIHHHIDFELCCIDFGNGMYQADRNYNISSGDIFAFKPNNAHCISDIYSENMLVTNLHINPKYFWYIRSISKQDENLAVTFFSEIFPSDKINDFISEESKNRIVSRIKEMISEFQYKKRNYIYKVENLLNEIIIELSRYQIKRKSDISVSAKCADDIFKTVKYIDKRFCERLDLNELSAMANLSRTYYSHVFKSVVGLNVWEYISIKRTEFAISQLKNTDKSVIEIALSCGFNNTANFNKIFKKYTGLTPRALRKL